LIRGPSVDFSNEIVAEAHNLFEMSQSELSVFPTDMSLIELFRLVLTTSFEHLTVFFVKFLIMEKFFLLIDELGSFWTDRHVDRDQSQMGLSFFRMISFFFFLALDYNSFVDFVVFNIFF